VWVLTVRVMRTFRPGREATIREVHISAVHMTAATESVFCSRDESREEKD
jgi:hypothetical protein